MDFLTLLLRIVLGWLSPPGRMQPIRVRADGSTDATRQESDPSVSFQVRLARFVDWYLREGTSALEQNRLGRFFLNVARGFRSRGSTGEWMTRRSHRN